MASTSPARAAQGQQGLPKTLPMSIVLAAGMVAGARRARIRTPATGSLKPVRAVQRVILALHTVGRPAIFDVGVRTRDVPAGEVLRLSSGNGDAHLEILSERAQAVSSSPVLQKQETYYFGKG
ncbi:hypothetical protein JB92DRAFT_3134482 [Gautieria morchelliformis]|nr:hypothetical protein JB92DRAFT_3134482 [Gautieria morchelliformis]